jgi:hypothetical protein
MFRHKFDDEEFLVGTSRKYESQVHSMSWSRMGTPKGKGGLGFQDLVCFNMTLLAKQGWRLLTSLDSITSQIIKAKYYHYSSILEANV